MSIPDDEATTAASAPLSVVHAPTLFTDTDEDQWYRDYVVSRQRVLAIFDRLSGGAK